MEAPARHPVGFTLDVSAPDRYVSPQHFTFTLCFLVYSKHKGLKRSHVTLTIMNTSKHHWRQTLLIV